MKRKCVFKASVSDVVFKAVEVKEFDGETLWAVLKGRVYATRPFLYRTLDEAIGRVIYLAKLELSKKDLLTYEP